MFTDTETPLSPKDSESHNERYPLLGQDSKESQLFGRLIKEIISNFTVITLK